MDPITQGILGAAASQSIMKRRLPKGAGWIGAVGGVAADLDVLIHSASDPTIGWLYHRHFTHSLAFIPVGGFLAALPFLFLTRFKNHRRDVILSSIIGYATHGLLDAFTNYGTQLFWPFSNHRVAWDWIGIVDPIYTLILLVGVWLTARSSANEAGTRGSHLVVPLHVLWRLAARPGGGGTEADRPFARASNSAFQSHACSWMAALLAICLHLKRTAIRRWNQNPMVQPSACG
ncbi:MAG: metal-dependent hydrolase [Acidobacteria bacterium]|nr:metal-dependent hydrolase [Acidobacteriota bacterium]